MSVGRPPVLTPRSVDLLSVDLDAVKSVATLARATHGQCLARMLLLRMLMILGLVHFLAWALELLMETLRETRMQMLQERRNLNTIQMAESMAEFSWRAGYCRTLKMVQ